MNVDTEALFSPDQTIEKMYWLIDTFNHDLYQIKSGDKKAPKASIRNWYDTVKKIPFQLDRKPVEVIARPKYIWKKKYTGADCKKKSILIGSWCAVNRLPKNAWRLTISSVRDDGQYHHVFPEIKINGKWYALDATYRQNEIFRHVPYKKKKGYSR